MDYNIIRPTAICEGPSSSFCACGLAQPDDKEMRNRLLFMGSGQTHGADAWRAPVDRCA